MSLLGWLQRRRGADDAEVRGEIWRLGTRYLGWPLEGALQELAEPDIPPERERLLLACVRDLQSR